MTLSFQSIVDKAAMAEPSKDTPASGPEEPQNADTAGAPVPAPVPAPAPAAQQEEQDETQTPIDVPNPPCTLQRHKRIISADKPLPDLPPPDNFSRPRGEPYHEPTISPDVPSSLYALTEAEQAPSSHLSLVTEDNEATGQHSRSDSAQLPSYPPQSHSPEMRQLSVSKSPLFDSTPSSPRDFKKTSIQYSPVQSNRPVFVPTSSVGPNGLTRESHRPGQITHPNMNFSDPRDNTPWMHDLCECSSDVNTCMSGFFCACVLDSKTAYRLSAKSERRDPTVLLGFKSLNARCIATALSGLCGLCCKLIASPDRRQVLPQPLTTPLGILPMISRIRIRNAYHLSGDIASDMVESCCCCCCVIIQNEREVRDREDKIRALSGPAQGVMEFGTSGIGRRKTDMVYAPGGG